jgi:TolB protein
VPLPEYASRDQTLGRGEEKVAGRIVFPLYDPERGTYDIYIANAADGTDLTVVQENASQPAVNEDGSLLAYRSWQPDDRGLFSRHLGGSDDWRFDPFFESARPQFSYVDDSLIFHSRAGGKEPAIYKVVDGIPQVMRRESYPIQGEAAKLSPDGQQFVYNGCLPGGKCGIIRSNINGNDPIILSDHPTDTNPEVSPDGSTVVFMSKRGGDWEIYRVGINGGEITALTSDDASDGLPTWSPDGEKIAFVANRDGEWAVWDMDPDGSNQRRLFALDGPVDGIVQHDRANSRGWVEENIDWVP